MKVIYTAHSKHNYYAKRFVSTYVLTSGNMPLNPFMNWDYFLDDLVKRETIHKANEQLIKMSDEVWQFGEISNGCYHELVMAMELKMPIKFFTVGGHIDDIKPIANVNDLIFEDELLREIGIDRFKDRLLNILS